MGKGSPGSRTLVLKGTKGVTAAATLPVLGAVRGIRKLRVRSLDEGSQR